MPTVHLLITGKVQGVFYRANAKKAADANGVKGWVQNTPEGNVEIVASASQNALDAFIEWCRRGTTMAKVEGVEITEAEAEAFDDFDIRR